MQKNYKLSEEDVNIIKRVKEELGVNTEVKALRHILHKYAEIELGNSQSGEIAQQVFRRFEMHYEPYWRRLYKSVRETDKAVSLITYMLNTMLLEDEIEKCIPPTLYKSPVLEEAQAYLRDDLGKRKQRKDSRTRREKSH